MYRLSAALCLAVFLFASAVPANSPESIASYGGAVAVGDGYLFVAEPGGFKNPGMVHVYLREKDQSWILRASLQGPECAGWRWIREHDCIRGQSPRRCGAIRTVCV